MKKKANKSLLISREKEHNNLVFVIFNGDKILGYVKNMRMEIDDVPSIYSFSLDTKAFIVNSFRNNAINDTIKLSANRKLFKTEDDLKLILIAYKGHKAAGFDQSKMKEVIHTYEYSFEMAKNHQYVDGSKITETKQIKHSEIKKEVTMKKIDIAKKLIKSKDYRSVEKAFRLSKKSISEMREFILDLNSFGFVINRLSEKEEIFRVTVFDNISFGINIAAYFFGEYVLELNIINNNTGKSVTINYDVFDRFRNLKEFHLDKIRFEDQMILNKDLDVLSLTNTKLREVPESISRCKNIKVLKLRNNFISKIPGFVFGLKSLIELDLTENIIYDISEDISKSKLHILKLKSNKLSAEASWHNDIAPFPLTLKELDLKFNYFTQETISELKLIYKEIVSL